jgi:hypothetical protein
MWTTKDSGSAYCARRKTAAVHTARDEDLDGVSYNVQRIRSRRRSCSELFDCLTEMPRCDSILFDRCCSVINDQWTVKWNDIVVEWSNREQEWAACLKLKKELTAIIYCTSGEVTRANNNVMNLSTLCMSQVWTCLCWKDNCPVCRCASCLFTQCTTGSSQRSISAMTRCHWRSEDDVAERIEPHDVVTESAWWAEEISLVQNRELLSDFKYKLRETHQVKVEELIPRSAQVFRLSSNTAEVGRLWSNAAEVWQKRRVRVIEDSGRFDRDIEDSGRVSTVLLQTVGVFDFESHLTCIWELLCWNKLWMVDSVCCYFPFYVA